MILFLFVSKTVEAERISVDHVAHLKPSDGGSAATQCEPITYLSNLNVSLILFFRRISFKGWTDQIVFCLVVAQLTGIHSAIKMLGSRIRVLHHYLQAMQKGMCVYFCREAILYNKKYEIRRM